MEMRIDTEEQKLLAQIEADHKKKIDKIIKDSPIDIDLLASAIYGYNRGIAGQAFTTWTCAKCKKTANHHNTAVPIVCMDCAKKIATAIVVKQLPILKQDSYANPI